METLAVESSPLPGSVLKEKNADLVTENSGNVHTIASAPGGRTEYEFLPFFTRHHRLSRTTPQLATLDPMDVPHASDRGGFFLVRLPRHGEMRALGIPHKADLAPRGPLIAKSPCSPFSAAGVAISAQDVRMSGVHPRNPACSPRATVASDPSPNGKVRPRL